MQVLWQEWNGISYVFLFFNSHTRDAFFFTEYVKVSLTWGSWLWQSLAHLTLDMHINMLSSWQRTGKWTCEAPDLWQTHEHAMLLTQDRYFNISILGFWEGTDKWTCEALDLWVTWTCDIFLLGTGEGSSWLATNIWTYDWSCNLWNNYKWLIEITIFNTQSCIQFNFALVGVSSDFWFH